MRDELITLYAKNDPDRPEACLRAAYYDADFTTYQDRHPALIDVFLFNRHGEMLLQKRARNKRFNPGRLHTTIGGHVNWEEKADFTVVHECMEELGAAALVYSKDVYAQAFQKLGPYTDKTALLCELGSTFRDYRDDPIEARRTIKDRVWLYLGRYDGPIENPDRSSAGYEWMDLDTIRREFIRAPDQFTDGLMIYLEAYGDEMAAFIERYCDTPPSSAGSRLQAPNDGLHALGVGVPEVEVVP